MTPAETKVAQMRRRFDEAFAAPSKRQAGIPEALLAITMGGEGHALRLRDIAALAAVPQKILSVPSSVPELIGITALRGEVVPLFSLARLLGLGGAAGHVRWMVLAGEGSHAVALGFEDFNGYLQVSAAEVFPRSGPAERPYIAETARHNGVLRGIVDIASLAQGIRNREWTASTK